MRILLAVFGCHRYEYSPDDWFKRPTVDRLSALRDTWLKDVTVDYKIFKGRCPKGLDIPTQGDEVWLDAGDDYRHSNEKIKGVIAYALERGYDYLIKVDDDVYCYWERMNLNPTADYMGGGGPQYRGQYCAGITYYLSRRAMQILSNTSLATSDINAWAEDRWVGTSLWRHQIRCEFDLGYYVAKPTRTNQYISDADLEKLGHTFKTVHAMTPDQMRGYHAKRLQDRRGTEGQARLSDGVR
jgi:hypothetical protein